MVIDQEKPELTDLLDLVDKVFGIEKVLKNRGREIVAAYYEQSSPAYEKFHSAQGCMHLAINPDGVFSFDGYHVQPGSVIDEVRAVNGKRVLELGCGKGFNSLYCAERMHEVEFVGMDLLSVHVSKAREFAKNAGRTNLSYHLASFEPLPDSFREFDVAFAFETLCHAKDPDLVAASIAASLRPGGRLVMYDMHAQGRVEDLPPDLATATRLCEVAVAVTEGFFPVGQWEASFAKAGLVVDEPKDLTAQVLPGLKRQMDMSFRALSDWKKQIAIKALPKLLTRNAIAALLTPHIVRLGREQDDGVLSYQKITATKPL